MAGLTSLNRRAMVVVEEEWFMARKVRRKTGSSSADTCVIFASRQDECWIAHSLRMDQIGTGQSVLEALEDLLRAIEQVRAEARADKSIEIFREAPARIQRMAESATPLPKELFEVAHKRVHGNWPKEIKIRTESTRKRFKAELREPAAT